MEEVLQALASFFVYAVVAVFAQNAVFTRALGVSRVVKLVDDGTVDTVMFGSLLCAVQLISAPLGYFASGWISQLPYRDYIRPLVFLGCAAVAFFVVLLFSVVIFRVDGARRAVAVLPMATFNTCLLGTLLISSVQNFNFAQTLGFALGSGIGYVLVMLIVGAMRELIGAGTLYGVVVFQQPILPIATLPSGGFIFLAVLVALWRGFVTAAKHQLGVEEG